MNQNCKIGKVYYVSKITGQLKRLTTATVPPIKILQTKC